MSVIHDIVDVFKNRGSRNTAIVLMITCCLAIALAFIIAAGWAHSKAQPGSEVTFFWISYTKGSDDNLETLANIGGVPAGCGITIDWPARVWAHEAFVGGRIDGFDRHRENLVVYACVETEHGPRCFLQDHTRRPVVNGSSWEAFVRLGNEWPELNYLPSPIPFDLVAVVTPDLAMLPAEYPGLAGDLIDQKLAQLKLVHSKPFRIERIIKDQGDWVISRICRDGTPVETLYEVPKPRRVLYHIRPPVTLRWERVDGTEAGPERPYLEVYHDDTLKLKQGEVDSYTVERWPEGIHRIEVKISAFKDRGPYDSIYLKLVGEGDETAGK